MIDLSKFASNKKILSEIVEITYFNERERERERERISYYIKLSRALHGLSTKIYSRF